MPIRWLPVDRIGYFIPEFPGQTHIFFWREMRALSEKGIETDIVSTRLPPKGIISHEWAKEAITRTSYLAPISFGSAIGALGEVLRCGPAAWLRCLKSVCQADGVSITGKLRLLAMVLIGGRLSRLARQRGWRHVHVHSCADSANIALFASLLSGITYSMTLHGPLSYFGPNQRQKWSHSAFDVVITKTLLNEAKALLNGSLPATVLVAPMGVDLRQLQRTTPYTPWDGTGTCRLFCCGRLNAGKGYEELIRAVGILRDRGMNLHLRIAGEDDAGGSGYRKNLESLRAELKLDHHVTLLGAVAEQVVRQELENAHVFALASRQEALGVAIMEAMAMGVPAIATQVGGVPELVSTENDGLLVEPRQPQQLADAIERLSHDPNLCKKFSEQGRKKVMQSFDSSVSAGVIADEVRRLA
jgi:glycosyltransferase involved in cell wall biosynthesis